MATSGKDQFGEKMETKLCRTNSSRIVACGKEKSISEFYKRGSLCKECICYYNAICASTPEQRASRKIYNAEYRSSVVIVPQYVYCILYDGLGIVKIGSSREKYGPLKNTVARLKKCGFDGFEEGNIIWQELGNEFLEAWLQGSLVMIFKPALSDVSDRGKQTRHSEWFYVENTDTAKIKSLLDYLVVEYDKLGKTLTLLKEDSWC